MAFGRIGKLFSIKKGFHGKNVLISASITLGKKICYKYPFMNQL